MRKQKPIVLTDEQKSLLAQNEHLVPVEKLWDGDVLVLDKETPGGELRHFGPYILTVKGHVQDVNFHYRLKHDMPELPA